MEHPDENTLELYVLNATSSEGKRDGIEAHLRKCEGCRITVDRMLAYYMLADRLENVNLRASTADEPSSRSRSLAQIATDGAMSVSPVRKQPLHRLVDLTRMHPLMTGGGAMFAMGIIAAATLLLTRDTPDSNPSFVHINTEQGMLEVYNRSREKLWQLPGVNVQNAMDPQLYQQTQRAEVTDIDGNGKNEVLCSVTLAGPEGQPRTGFSIFSWKKARIAFTEFVRPIHYRGVDYPSVLTPSGFAVGQKEGNEKDIFVVALNERSPMLLARVDPRGEVRGEYWHFGHLPLILSEDIDNDGKEEIVLGGVDDTQDGHGGRFPVVVILDPLTLKSISESPATIGFGKTSMAEKYHIRFPVSDIELAINAPGAVTEMDTISFNGQSALSFWVKQRLSGEIAVAFEYIFSRSLEILAVRSSGPSDILHGRLVQEGRLSGTIDSGYLDNLRRGVRFWNVQGWSSSKVAATAPPAPMH